MADAPWTPIAYLLADALSGSLRAAMRLFEPMHGVGSMAMLDREETT